ncbi:MAG: helix-turn-helix transcriptional regulator [Streptococcus sp.]
MNVEIAQRLAEMRREKGFSQEELAARLGLSRQAVSKWERAESSPDTGNLIALADLYGVTLDELVRVEADIADDVTFESSRPCRLRRGRGGARGCHGCRSKAAATAAAAAAAAQAAARPETPAIHDATGHVANGVRARPSSRLLHLLRGSRRHLTAACQPGFSLPRGGCPPGSPIPAGRRVGGSGSYRPPLPHPARRARAASPPHG